MLTSNGATDTEQAEATLTYYPIYTHSSHPLSQDWVKIPARLIARLHVPHGWEASHPRIDCDGAAPTNPATSFPLFHYLNHPLPYIQVCGVVVDITYSPHLRSWVVQLDDSSGQLVDILVKKHIDPDIPKQQWSKPGTSTRTKLLQDRDIIPIYVLEWMACSWMGNAIFDVRPIEIGSIMRAKGRLSPWKKGRQLLLEKFDLFPSTSQEIAFWNQMTEDFNLVLRQPWTLTSQKQEELRLEFEASKARQDKYARKMAKKARMAERLKQMPEKTAEPLPNERELLQPELAEQREKNESMLLDDPSENYPVTNGLAPSYQVPKVESSRTNESSRNTHDAATEIDLGGRADGASAELPIRGTLDTASDGFKSGASTLNFEDTSIVTATDTDTASILVDMGSPSHWEEVLVDNPSKSTSSHTGSAWLKVRAAAASRNNTSSMAKENAPRKNAPEISVQQAWEELEL